MSVRVLHVLASNDRRGAEVFATDLALALEPHDVRSSVVAVSRSHSTATVDADALGQGLGLAVLRSLRRLARQHDVVIAHGSTALPASAIACAGVTPFVYRSIGDPAYWSSSAVRRWRSGMLLARAQLVVTLWDEAAETLRRRGTSPDRLAVIPNGVLTERFPAVTVAERQAARSRLGIPDHARVVLYLGALSKEKRPDRAVALAAARPDLEVLVVGDGPERTTVETAARDLPNLSVEGPTTVPHRYLAAADVVFIPSDTEGIPATAIEAGLSGLPVVASRVGGLSAVVDHGSTGFLVDQTDETQFALRVDDALAAGREMGQRARNRCLERFDMAVVAGQWADVIDRVARTRTGR